MNVPLPVRALARALAAAPGELPETLPLPAAGASWSGIRRGALRRPGRAAGITLTDARLLLLAAGQDPHGQLAAAAGAAGIPVLASPLPAGHARRRLNRFLARRLRVIRPGTLLRIAGRGVLLTGPAGSGKSDLALELLERGHALVADDAVALARSAAGRLQGSCPPPLPARLGLRDLGLVDPRQLYGPGATATATELDLWVDLAPAPAGNALDGRWQHTWLLGVRLAQLTLGGTDRPRALLLETAVRTLAVDRGRRGVRSYVAQQRSRLA